MKKITYVEINKQHFVQFPEERISGLILPSTDFTSASVGEVAPGIAQASHSHKRPQNGDEIIFVYQGYFEFVTENGTQKFNADRIGPVFIQVPAGVQGSIKNIGNRPVRFFSVFSPPFKMGEINYW
ncbi:MAG: hypothetical protein PHS02_00155 [Candidatus ainarchaeum sp.]|nr:hypothetical protein [Candidatus ainarchaeum sp.]